MGKLMHFFLMIAISIISISTSAQEAATGIIKGKIIDKSTKQPVAFATVGIKENQYGATTDTAGVFTIRNVKEGVYQLVVSNVGYQELTINDIRVARSKINYLELEIEAAASSLQEVTVKSKSFRYENSPQTPVSTYSFSREEISRNPGAQGDIFRAIGMLPGVSSSGGEYSAIAVRGQGTRDNIYMVDDIPVTEVGHLEGGGGFNDPNGGRFSIFAPRVIDNAQFQSGGIAAQYGRRSASYLALGIKEGNKADYTIDGQLDLLGFTINYDGPSYLNKNTSIFLSARYQNFAPIVGLLNMQGAGTPNYADFIFKSTTQLGKKNKLSVIAIVSPDNFIRDLEDIKAVTDSFASPSLLNRSTRKNIFGLNLRTLTSKNSYWKNVIYYTQSKSDVTSGIAFVQFDKEGKLTNANDLTGENNLRTVNRNETKLGYRSIYTVNFQNRSKLAAGIDLDRTELTTFRQLSRPDTSYNFNANNHPSNPALYYTTIDPQFFNTNFNDAKINASAYIDYSFSLFKKLTLNVGGRYDYTGFTEQHTFSPRLSGNLQLNETNSINFATGIYYQDPVYSEIADQPTGKLLREEQVTNYIVGYKKQFSPDLKFTIEGWYKTFDKMVVRPNSHYNEQTNTGTGWAGGIDVNVTKRLTKRIHGQAGYSYMQSKRNDNDGLGEYDFDFSQPHQFNLLVSYKAKKHWLLSSKFRYATGKPTDKLIIHPNVFNNANFIRYSAETVGNNLERFNSFISLDLRADYRFQVKRVGLTAFVDIVNIMNRTNEAERNLNIYSGTINNDGLGLFPTFGLKFEF